MEDEIKTNDVMSPADTRQAQQHATHLLGSVLTWGGVKELIGADLFDRSVLALRALDDLWDDRERLLAVGERDKAEIERIHEIIRSYVLAISRAPNNQDENEVEEASKALVAIVMENDNEQN